MTAKQFTLPFIKKEQLAKNTYSFYFDRTKESFDFVPGQYIRMILPHIADDRGTSRFFTIASSPLEKAHLMITTKLFKSTFKETLHNLTSQQSVQFFGPMGNFVFNEKDTNEKIFISAGVGITPFHSMVTYAAAKNITAPITLIAAFSTTEEIIFYKKLTEIAKKHPNINIIFEVGKVSELFLKKHINSDSIGVTNPHKAKHYIVGAQKTVEEIKQILLDLTIAPEKIFTEDFTGY